MSVTYIKRHRMEIDLRRRVIPMPQLPSGYRFLPWNNDLLEDHGDVKYESFHGEMDSEVFQCLGTHDGCLKLMRDISSSRGFVPEATWLIVDATRGDEPCATIQGSRVDAHLAAIHNVGVVADHRQLGLGAALVLAALYGFQQVGLPAAYLEVTARNKHAARLYQHLGFRRTKTIYKTVELAFS